MSPESKAAKPAPQFPAPEQVPPELLHLKRWVGYLTKWDESKKKWKKPPHSPLDGSAIGATPKYAEHFTTFAEAVAGVQKHGLDGVGFVFVEGDGYAGIDFDNCIDPDTGEMDPAVAQWLKFFATTYVEESPSGTGCHIICKATIPHAVTAKPIGNQGATVEIYSKDRYFTFTGKNLTVMEVRDDHRLPN